MQTNVERINLPTRRQIRHGRANEMAAKYRAGATLVEIGNYYGITRERVRQLLAEIGITGRDGGAAQRAEVKRKAAKARKELRYLRAYGVTVAQFNRIQQGLPLSTGPYKQFVRQRANAGSRGVGWNLTFGEWWAIWAESGNWEQRGRGIGGYVMARHGDTGPYALGNIKIILATENQSEYIRRYWKEVREGKRPTPRPNRRSVTVSRYAHLQAGESITHDITTKNHESTRNHAYHAAKGFGWKIKTKIRGGAITVTRIS